VAVLIVRKFWREDHMTGRWVTAFVYAAGSLAMAGRLSCYVDFYWLPELSLSAQVAVAGSVIVGLAALVALFELRAGAVLGLAGVCLSWRYFGELAAYFPWRNFAGAVHQELCGWPEVMGILGLVAATLCSLFPLRAGRMRDRPFKYLSLILPSVQVLILIAYIVFKASPAFPSEGYRLMDLIWRVNYPLTAALLPSGYVIDGLCRYLPGITGGWIETATAILFITFLLSSMALFWYFVATEIEMRRQGKSRLRFAGTVKGSLAVAVLFVFGTAALFYAYRTSLDWISPGNRSATFLEVAIFHGDLYFERLIMVIWGLIFLRMAIHDFIILWVKKETRL